MDAEFYPNTELNTETTGFFPVKLKVNDTNISAYNSSELISGFEIYINDFDLQDVSEDAKTVLAGSVQKVQFSTSGGDHTEFRVAMFFALSLAELAEGIIENPQDGTFYTPEDAAISFPVKIKEYEEQTPEANFTTHPFEQWL